MYSCLSHFFLPIVWVWVVETIEEKIQVKWQSISLYYYNNHSNYESFDHNSIHYCYKVVTVTINNHIPGVTVGVGVTIKPKKNEELAGKCVLLVIWYGVVDPVSI